MVLPLITGQSAGVVTRENDQSLEALGATTSIGAIVFGSKKGSLSPQRKTSASSFTAEYGPSDISWGYGHVSALAFFDQGNQCQCLRISGVGAKYAGSSISYIDNSAPSNNTIGLATYFSPGTSTGFESDGGISQYTTLLTSPFSTGCSISGQIVCNNINVNVSPVGFNTDQATTLQNLVVSINAALSVMMQSLVAQIPEQLTLGYPTATLIDSENGVIRIVAPEGVPIQISFVVSNNTPAASLLVLEANLVDIFAENPGDWANDVGWNITNIDKGIFQRSTLTFSNQLVTGNVVTITLLINNIPTPIEYTVQNGISSDQAMADIASIIVSNFNTGSVSNVTVTYPNGFGANFARIISLIAPNAGPNVIGMQSYSITGGSNQSAVYFNETLAGIASTNTFTFNIFQRGNLVYPVRSYVASLSPQLNGFQDQIFLEEMVNVSASRSDSVRVKVNSAMVAAGILIDPARAADFAIIRFLTGGNNGALPTNGQISAGWDVFRDAETYPMNILINAGYTDAAVQQNIADVADTRRDCTAIIDVPSDVQDVQSAYTWRTQASNMNTSFAALCSPDILILDNATDQRIFVPRSGYDASRYAYTDKNFATWFAPAGYDRGRLPQALQFRYKYSKPDRDILDGVQINCGKQAADGSGLLIFGENTTQVTPSLLSSVGVRRMLIFVENTIAKSLERHLFDQNSEQLAFSITQELNAFLQPIQDNQGIKRFLVLCNPSKDPGYFADAGQLNVAVFIVPLRPVKIILLDTIITPSAINFNEFVINGVI